MKKVKFIMVAGKDFVRSEMPEGNAKRIVSEGKESHSSRFKEYPVCVDGTYFFTIEFRKKKDKKSADSTMETEHECKDELCHDKT